MQVAVKIDPNPQAYASSGWIGVWGRNILFQVGWDTFDGTTYPFECVVSQTGHVYSFNYLGPALTTGTYLPLVVQYVPGKWRVWYKLDGVWKFGGQTPLGFTPGNEKFQVSTEVYNGNPIPLLINHQSLPLSAPELQY
jgi:hypothetical protein